MRRVVTQVWGRRRVLGAVFAGMTLIAAPRAGAASIVEVADPIIALNDGLVSVMKSSATPFPQRYKTLAPIVQRVFDLPEILKTCVGPRWSGLSEIEQASLLDAFQKFTVASWVANFDSYNGERFDIVPKLRDAGGDQIVQTKVASMSGDSQRIDYVMRNEGGTWRAVDVLLDGSISRVAVQRSDFRSLLTGGDASALIASLKQKITDLSGGTLPT